MEISWKRKNVGQRLTSSQVAFTGAVRALQEAGVFEALPIDGTGVSADILAEKVNVEKDLLSKISFVYAVFIWSSDLDSPTDACCCPRTFRGTWTARIRPHPLFTDLSGSRRHVQVSVCQPRDACFEFKGWKPECPF